MRRYSQDEGAAATPPGSPSRTELTTRKAATPSRAAGAAVPGQRQRKYQEEYLADGFTFAIVDEQDRPKCLTCHELLANESMKPAKLRGHLETKHPNIANKPISYF